MRIETTGLSDIPESGSFGLTIVFVVVLSRNVNGHCGMMIMEVEEIVK